jgi:hypothetical protein
MKTKSITVQEPFADYTTNDEVFNGLNKIERAVKRGINKRSHLYKNIIVKHKKAWEKLANL